VPGSDTLMGGCGNERKKGKEKPIAKKRKGERGKKKARQGSSPTFTSFSFVYLLYLHDLLSTLPVYNGSKRRKRGGRKKGKKRKKRGGGKRGKGAKLTRPIPDYTPTVGRRYRHHLLSLCV